MGPSPFTRPRVPSLGTNSTVPFHFDGGGVFVACGCGLAARNHYYYW